MSPDHRASNGGADGADNGDDTDYRALATGRERLSDVAEVAIEGFDKRLIDLLAWLLETETRARIYIYLRQQPGSTSEEIATGTGLYPSTVREAIVELHEEAIVAREKRASEGAGNNPFEYEAIAPSELVRKLSVQVQAELNAVLCLDEYLDGRSIDSVGDAVTIHIEDVDAT